MRVGSHVGSFHYKDQLEGEGEGRVTYGTRFVTSVRCAEKPRPSSGTPKKTRFSQKNNAVRVFTVVKPPNRYMHNPVEVVSLSDLDAGARLLAETILHINKNTRFIPE